MAKRKYATNKEAMDMGTPEMARKFNIIPKLANPTTLTMRVMDGTEIDRMLFEDKLTAVEHGTLSTLEKKLNDFGYSDLRSPNYEGVISADPSLVAEKKAEKIRGAVNLIGKMDAAMGRYNRKKIINLALYNAPWGDKRDQIDALKYCIRKLDDLFNRR